MQDFDKKTNGKGYRFLKVLGDIFVLNIEFILATCLSLTVLFFPALFALVELFKNEKTSYVNPFSDYFALIKKHIKKGLKYWITFFPIYALLAYVLYLDYQLIHANENVMVAWMSLIIIIGILIVLTSALIELPLFIAYFDDEKALDCFRKASLIARKKLLLVLSSWMCILSFVLVFYMFYPLIFFFGIGLMVYLVTRMSERVYEQLVREEKARLKEE